MSEHYRAAEGPWGSPASRPEGSPADWPGRETWAVPAGDPYPSYSQQPGIPPVPAEPPPRWEPGIGYVPWNSPAAEP